MGTKKLLHKMPLQKRVPLKKARTTKPVPAEKTAPSVPALALEDVADVAQLEAFVKSQRLSVANSLKKYLSQRTENAAFETRGTNAFIGLCLDYVLDNLCTKFANSEGIMTKEELFAEADGLVQTIAGLEAPLKWATIEWTQQQLRKFIATVESSFAVPAPSQPLRLIIFIELVKALLAVGEEIENPLILATVSLSCRALQLMRLEATETAIHYLALLWETFAICEENKQTFPEGVAFLTKLTNFLGTSLRNVDSNQKPEGEKYGTSLLDLVRGAENKEIGLLRATLKLCSKICITFAASKCYESIAGTVQQLIAALSEKHAPLVAALWKEYEKSIAATQAKHKEKIKEPLQLLAQKPKEIPTFEPIIADTYLPFKSRDKNPKPEILEKRDQKRKNQARRVEMRKMKKETKLREELKMEEVDHFRNKQNTYAKKERKALEQDYM